jgi:uncharacterized protein YfeS
VSDVFSKEEEINECNFPKLLEEIIPEEKLNISGDSVLDEIIIEERNGVNYITEFNIEKNIKNIDSDFRDLVESVLQKKA